MLSTIKFYLFHLIDEWRMLKYMRPKNELSSILIETHRLEKSMCLSNQIAGKGFDRALNLLRAIDQLSGKAVATDAGARFAIETGVATIRKFISFKEKIETDRTKLNKLITYYNASSIKEFSTNDDFGGILSVNKEDFSASIPLITRLFTSRHSIRTFTGDINDDQLLQAIQLALCTPSACNRQPSHIYIINDRKLATALNRDSANDYGAPKHIFITADCSAYDIYEFNDWIVSASIFAGYLTLALHTFSIGCCIMRKDLIDRTPLNKIIRKTCCIPRQEKIILELLVGNYPSEFTAPVSRRKSLDETITII